jgi:hypothetical protein
MQISFNGIWIIGSVSIFIFNPLIAVVYFLVFPTGVLFFIVGQWICPRCPHIREHESCLQLPAVITKKLINRNVSGPLNVYEKIGFFILLYGLILFPLPWVMTNQYLFIPYAVLGLMHYPAYYFHFCEKCLNVYCPHKMLIVSAHSS